MRITALFTLLLALMCPALAEQPSCDPKRLEHSVVSIGDAKEGPKLFGAAWFVAQDALVTSGKIGDTIHLTGSPQDILIRHRPLSGVRTPGDLERVRAHVESSHDHLGPYFVYVVKLDRAIERGKPLRVLRTPRVEQGLPIMAIGFSRANPFAATGTVAPNDSDNPRSLIYFNTQVPSDKFFDLTTEGAPLADCSGNVLGVMLGQSPTPTSSGGSDWTSKMGAAIPIQELARSLRK